MSPKTQLKSPEKVSGQRLMGISPKIYTLLLFSVFYILYASPVFAATLSVSPSSGAFKVGDSFSVSIVVASPAEAMNAVEGVLSFPGDKLQVISVSKSGSIINLWAQEPSFSNDGTVSFEGVALNPGFTGASGKILQITFKVKSAGSATLAFSSGSVLANDGKGTNILTGLPRAEFTLSSPAERSSVSPGSASSLSGSSSSVAEIQSPTHPDQAKWYRDNSPEFSWTLPAGALEVRTIISESPRATPSIRYAPPITEKTVEDLPDGTFYFLLQVRTSSGWGSVTRFQVNIDQTPPEKFRIKFPHGTVSLNPQPVILFNATDKASGVDHYEVKVGDGGPRRTSASVDANPYALDKLEPGSYTVFVSAFDRAENVTSAEENFEIVGIEPPKVTSYNEELTVGDILRVRGTTYPNADVEVIVSQGGAMVVTDGINSNSLGDFSVLVSKRLWVGQYTFTVRVTNAEGARSPETKPYAVTVRLHFFSDAVTFIVNYFLIALSLLIGIAIIAAAGIWSWFKLLSLTRTMRKESEEASLVLHQSFKVLRGDVDAHIRKLRKVRASRALTSEELEFLERFSGDLAEAEHIIAKEVADTSPARKNGKVKPK
ncbi:MAG: hypothetical protein HYV67_03520 [Candidatus Taylorbacteria bacterium]|nr:hypothetical protein [Candidatus Taylorbacteria bacterium]